MNLYTYAHNNPIFYFDPSGHNVLDDFTDSWVVGIDWLYEMGTAVSIFASYSEGAVYTLGNIGVGYANLVSDPVGTIDHIVSDFASDPLRNNAIYSVGSFYYNLAINSYNHDWNNVAYSMGNATSNVMAMGASTSASKLLGSAFPNGISFNGGSQYALVGDGNLSCATAVSSGTVATFGTVATGSVTGTSIMYSQSNDRGGATEAEKVANKLGFKKIKERSHNQPVFKKGRRYITPNVDSHKGGYWKMADSVKNLGSKTTRMGTYDIDLNWIDD